ncbi:cytochrome C [Delftia tsuruhatensis]|uniref:c-type cytochrome n=1 Tax=Delftia tsuruhatensis TaxID=180282 RepID=UPI0006426B1F|nr:cytochrome c [Delftia tsuruhatensis]KLO58062.1 cytochrome C [Delftia tsuruhatensis]
MHTLKKITLGVVGLAAVAGAAFWLATGRSEISPLQQIPVQEFSQQQIDQGRRLAHMGDCAVCHTAPGGQRNAGGLAMPSPFGTIYSTNITPDAETGIGRWSYEAFERAMRHGVDREGNYLYPAFPYTAFTRVTDEDMKALYAFLMTEPAVSNEAPKTALNFPFNVRRGLALWNALYLEPGEQPAPANQSGEWIRGAYLVEGLGHCAACHSPRNQFGAEKKGADHLAGAFIDGWDAPALNDKAVAPLPWTREDLVRYMQTGFSERHGVAAGPMAPVIEGLSHQSAEDINAMATYLMSYRKPVADAAGTGDAEALVKEKTEVAKLPVDAQGYRLYQGACMACHRADPSGVLAGSSFGVRPQLSLNTNLYSDSPTNAIHVVLNGITQPARPQLGTMPAFRHNLSDDQIATLLNTMRSQYGLQPWPGLSDKVKALREETRPGKVAAH